MALNRSRVRKGGSRPHSRKKVFSQKRREKASKEEEEESLMKGKSSVSDQDGLGVACNDSDTVVFDFPELECSGKEFKNSVEEENTIPLLSLMPLWQLANNQQIEDSDDKSRVFGENTFDLSTVHGPSERNSDVDKDNGNINDITVAISGEKEEVPSESKAEFNLSQCNEDKKEIGDKALDIEKSPCLMNGCRIVHYEHVIKDLLSKATDASLHEPSCKLNKWEVFKTRQRGFIIDVFLKCMTCKATIKHTSQPEDPNIMNVNEAIVLGCLTSGSGFSNMQELLAPAGIPTMSSTTYLEIQRKVVMSIIETNENAMLENIEEEKRLSKEDGNVIYYVADDGTITEVIYTTMICDGAWMQRTYSNGSFDSLAGFVVIIGKYTKKPLAVKVKSKTCAKCDSRKEYINDHNCFKNFPRNESSALMESLGVKECCHESWDLHKIVYKYFIGDGDSSVYNAILTDNPYDQFGIVVQKYEDINHKYKGHYRAIKKLSNKAGLKKEEKKWYSYASTFGLEINSEIAQVIERKRISDKDFCLEDNLEVLVNEILNVPYHFFGDHSKCAKLGGWPCDGISSEGEINYVPQLTNCGVMDELLELQRKLTISAKSLFLKTTTNLAENFNSVVCKYNCGKRIAYCKSGSFAARVHAASIKCLTKRVQTNVIQHSEKLVPSTVTKVENERIQKVERNKLYHSKKRKLLNTNVYKDKDYGEKANEPDMDAVTYNIQKDIVLKSLKDYQEKRLEIAVNTSAQYNCKKWFLARQKMITSSRYGPICRMFQTTKRGPTVSDMLYNSGKTINADMAYGLQHENDAKQALKEKINHTVHSTGFWIDPVHEFLGATPDGLLDVNLEDLQISKELGIAAMKRPLLLYKVEKGCCVEIKCPARGKNKSINDLLTECQDLQKIYDSKQPNSLNKNHRHYYQLQGQMHHTERKDGLLVLWTDKDIKITPVFRDDNFWRTKMEPKLISFFFDCLLPEIVDSRKRRSLDVKEPVYVTESQKNSNIAKKEPKNTKANADFPFVNKTVAKKREAAKRKIKIEMDKNNNCNIEGESVNKIAKIIDKAEIKMDTINDCNTKDESLSNMDKIISETETNVSDDDDIIFVPNNDSLPETPEKVRSVLLAIPLNGNMESIAEHVLNVDVWLGDEDIDTFLFLLREKYQDFEFLSVLNMGVPHCVKPCSRDEDLQIIGGSCVGHWRTCHYKKQTNELFIYESKTPPTYDKLSDAEKYYLSKRYPSIDISNTKLLRTGNQIDGSTCGVYSCAAVLSVLLGHDMRKEYFSSDSLLMREHFIKILFSKKIERFPQE